MARKSTQQKEKEQQAKEQQAKEQQAKEQQAKEQEAINLLQAQLAASQESSKVQEMNAEKYKQSCQLLEEEKKTLELQIKQLEDSLIELTKSQSSPEEKLNEFQQLCQYNHKVIGDLREKLAASEQRVAEHGATIKQLQQQIFQANLDVIRSVEAAKSEGELRAKILNSLREVEEKTRKIILDQQVTITELENQNQHIIVEARALQENLQSSNQAKEDLQTQFITLQNVSQLNEKRMYSEMLNWKVQCENEQRERLKLAEKQTVDDLSLNLKESLTKTILEKDTMIKQLQLIQTEQQATINSLNLQITEMTHEIGEKNMAAAVITKTIEEWRKERAGQQMIDENTVEELLQGYATERALKEQALMKLDTYEKQIKEKLIFLRQKEEDYIAAKAQWDEKTIQIENVIKEMLILKDNNVELQQKCSLIQQEIVGSQLEAQTLKQQLLSSLSENNKLNNELKRQEKTIEKLKRKIPKKPTYQLRMVEERPLADESYREDNYNMIQKSLSDKISLSERDLENNASILRSDFGEMYPKEPSLKFGESFQLIEGQQFKGDKQMDIEFEKPAPPDQSFDFLEETNNKDKIAGPLEPKLETLVSIRLETSKEVPSQIGSSENQNIAPTNVEGSGQTENLLEQPVQSTFLNVEPNNVQPGSEAENIGAEAEANKISAENPNVNEKPETIQPQQVDMENEAVANQMNSNDAIVAEEQRDQQSLSKPEQQVPVLSESNIPKETNFNLESQKILEEIRIEDLSDSNPINRQEPEENFGINESVAKKLTGPQISQIKSGKMLHTEEDSDEYDEMQEELEIDKTNGMEEESSPEDEQEPENSPSFKDIEGLQNKNILLIKRLVELKSELKIMRLTLDQEKTRYDALVENKSTVVYIRIANGNPVPVNLAEEGIRDLLESNRALQSKFIELENENKGLKLAAKKLQQDFITCEANNQLLKLSSPNQALNPLFVPVDVLLQHKNQLSLLQKEKDKAFYDLQQANKKYLEQEQQVRRSEALVEKLTTENHAKTAFCQKLQEELASKSNQKSIESDLAYLLKNETKELKDSFNVTNEVLKLRAQNENHILLLQKKDEELDWYRSYWKDVLHKDQKVLKSLAAEPVYHVPLEKLYGLLSRKEGENVSQILQAQQLILEQPKPLKIIKVDQDSQTLKDSSEEHPKAIKAPKRHKQFRYIASGKKTKAGRHLEIKEESVHSLTAENLSKEETFKKKKIIPPTSEARKARMQRKVAKENSEPIAQPVLEYANMIQQYEQKLGMSLREKNCLQEFIDQLHRLLELKNRELNETEIELMKQIDKYSRENTTLRSNVHELKTLTTILITKLEQKELVSADLCKDTMEFFKEINDQWLVDYENLKQDNLSLSFKLKENKYEKSEKELALENEILRLKRSGDIAAQIDLEGQLKVLIKENQKLRMKQQGINIEILDDNKPEFNEGNNLNNRLIESQESREVPEELMKIKKVKKIEEEVEKITIQSESNMVSEP